MRDTLYQRRVKKRFAWLPTRFYKDRVWTEIWLEPYYRIELWGGILTGWFEHLRFLSLEEAQEHLKRIEEDGINY